jgi:hypothetical protein
MISLDGMNYTSYKMSVTERQIRSNIDLSTLFTYCEVGYLKEVLSALFEKPEMSGLKAYVYFKRTTERTMNINKEELDHNTVLFVVGDESNYLPCQFSDNVLAIFKAYLQVFDSNCRNLFHLPVGFNSRTSERPLKALTKRNISVFFSGNLHTGRYRLYGFLSGFPFLPFPLLHRLRSVLGENFHDRYDRSFISFTKKFATGLSPEIYSDKLYDSKIVLCPPGNPGIETMRHFEAMRAGCIIISEKLPETECYKNSPIIIVNSWKEADSLIRELLNDPVKAEEIHQAMVSWWLVKCSPQAIAEYIISKLNSLGK